jgi:hypothetical protein
VGRQERRIKLKQSVDSVSRRGMNLTDSPSDRSWAVIAATRIVLDILAGRSPLRASSAAKRAHEFFETSLKNNPSKFKIECANNPNFADRSRQAKVRRTMSSSSLDLASAILSRQRPSPEVTDAVQTMSQAMREDLGISIDERAATRRLWRFSAAKRVYVALLRRVRPAFVLVVDHPSEFALVAAAKERGSVVLELQHGIVDRSHPSYAWTAQARPYRATMPLPDRLLLYGEHWRQELDQGFWDNDARPVGNPRVDRWRRAGINRDDDVCTILFTTQGLDIPGVTAFVQSFLRSLSDRTRVRLVIKLHPIYDVDAKPYRDALSAFSDRVEILAGHEGASTFEWLRRSHLHISVASGSHYEAIGLGVPTVILPFDPCEVVMPLHRAGHALFAPTPGDLARLVTEWRDLTVPENVSDYYFTLNARANILRELELP